VLKRLVEEEAPEGGIPYEPEVAYPPVAVGLVLYPMEEVLVGPVANAEVVPLPKASNMEVGAGAAACWSCWSCAAVAAYFWFMAANCVVMA